MKVLSPLIALVFAVGVATPVCAMADLRIAVVQSQAGPCAELGPAADAGVRAYHELLARRLGAKVLACPVVDAMSAGRALAAGKVDLAVLNPAAYAPVAGSTRAILTVRPKGGISRIPVIVAVKAASSAKGLSDLKGHSIVFGGAIPAARAVPRTALADQGAGPDFFSDEIVVGDAEAALAALRAGRADAVVLHAGAWQRQCRGDSPKEDRCADLRPVWQGRPIPASAIVIGKTMPAQTRFRLMGIFVAMHLEAPAAFAAASAFAPNGEEFEAAEAGALTPGTAAR